MEELALGRLHRDPISAAHLHVQDHLRTGEPLRPPPLGDLIRVGHRLEDALRSGLDAAGEFDGEFGGHSSGW
jgi:hypothetical protein